VTDTVPLARVGFGASAVLCPTIIEAAVGETLSAVSAGGAATTVTGTFTVRVVVLKPGPLDTTVTLMLAIPGVLAETTPVLATDATGGLFD